MLLVQKHCVNGTSCHHRTHGVIYDVNKLIQIECNLLFKGFCKVCVVMGRKKYRWCVVPCSRNTSVTTQNKIFIDVPRKADYFNKSTQ